jgi:hypothetical protein
MDLPRITCRALRQVFRAHPEHRLAKYFDIDMQWAVARERCARYGLVGAAPVRVLDLGGGLGWFVAAARHYGHTATLLEPPDACVAACAAILRVPHHVALLRPDSRLPPGPYDLVTMHRVNLRDMTQPDGPFWTPDQYERLAQTVYADLVPGGRWCLDPNHEAQPLVLDAPRWNAWLGARGVATLDDLATQYPASIAGPGRSITLTLRR